MKADATMVLQFRTNYSHYLNHQHNLLHQSLLLVGKYFQSGQHVQSALWGPPFDPCSTFPNLVIPGSIMRPSFTLIKHSFTNGLILNLKIDNHI